MSFKDPTDKQTLEKIYNEIREIKCADEAYTFVRKYFPDWIVLEIDDYAKEYTTLKKNWDLIVKSTRQTKKKILLVSKVVFTDPTKEYTVLCMLCEILTRSGFCVRRVEEFKKCEHCGLAIYKVAEDSCKECFGRYW